MMMKEYGDVDVHVVDNDDGGDAKEVIQSSTSLPRGNQVDGLPRVCSLHSLSGLLSQLVYARSLACGCLVAR